MRTTLPARVNIPWTWESPEIRKAFWPTPNRHLGELNGLSLIRRTGVDRFVQMHVVKETPRRAGNIEGTQTEMDEALEEDPEEIAPEKRDDWREVRNYISAMNRAIERLETLPLSNRLLCEKPVRTLVRRSPRRGQEAW